MHAFSHTCVAYVIVNVDPDPRVKERMFAYLGARSRLSAHQSALDLPRCVRKLSHSHAQSIITAERCRHSSHAQEPFGVSKISVESEHDTLGQVSRLVITDIYTTLQNTDGEEPGTIPTLTAYHSNSQYAAMKLLAVAGSEVSPQARHIYDNGDHKPLRPP
jgi:hypothetical protein